MPYAGIDIGADTIHVCTDLNPKTPVTALDLTKPDWWRELAALIPPGTTAALEPTGSHYSAPVIAALRHMGAAPVLINHATTGHVRELQIAGVKNDKTDARALAYIARALTQGERIRGTMTPLPGDLRAYGLRLTILAHARATKETTRTTNRLHQMAHAIAPILSQRLETYLRAARAGAVTATEIRDLATNPPLPDYKHHATRRALTELAAALPPWADGEPLRTAITAELYTLTTAEEHRTHLRAEIEAEMRSAPFAHFCHLWQPIPRYSPLYAAAILGATKGSPDLMTLARLKAAIGSHPKSAQSGQTTQTRAARQGFKPARAAMYLWTLGLIQEGQNPIAATFHKHKSAGERNAIYISRAKLAAILSGCARTGKPYNPHHGEKA